ncbi:MULTISPECIES: hypothetical protein [Pseudomonas]|uniref:Uncharacterized protein n=1 Tax=Pseudomonas marincola TaxID=437900 RepID=A0A653E868_9PSED|nr:hypothetical protein [Pseudomonas marincola]CAE6906444.1 conserved protein of unknown function [Pseudomonas marincola]
MVDNVTQLRQPPTVREVNEKNEGLFESAVIEVVKKGIEDGMTEAQMVGVLTFIIQEVLPYPIALIDGEDDPA